ncbi:hypothetical protein GAY29_10920 [Azospirillum brasilense]|uniref:hypothetical protein n=1 Tax=Azospirillum brasilense TaxID=192 RepID=UPI00190BAFA0|nr:hypothetical protein [Azospirillum brasilense]MBK3733621.1 hypothetical protein [Azospirillum brasilense]
MAMVVRGPFSTIARRRCRPSGGRVVLFGFTASADWLCCCFEILNRQEKQNPRRFSHDDEVIDINGKMEHQSIDWSSMITYLRAAPHLAFRRNELCRSPSFTAEDFATSSG